MTRKTKADLEAENQRLQENNRQLLDAQAAAKARSRQTSQTHRQKMKDEGFKAMTFYVNQDQIDKRRAQMLAIARCHSASLDTLPAEEPEARASETSIEAVIGTTVAAMEAATQAIRAQRDLDPVLACDLWAAWAPLRRELKLLKRYEKDCTGGDTDADEQ
jgi:hypothetical protein